MIRSHDCYLKRCLKNSLTQYSFYMIESRASSSYTRNIRRPSTPEEEVNQKEYTVGKIAERQQSRKSTHAQIPSVARFYPIAYCFAKKKIGICRATLIAFPSVKFPMIFWFVKNISALLSDAC